MTVAKRFGVLRLVGWILKIFAWIELVATVLFAIMAGIFGGGSNAALLTDQMPALAPLLSSGAGAIIAAVAVLLFGLIYFLLLYAAGESFHLQLALEENTRLTAALLLRMHQESQQDSRSTYNAPGFETERFER